MSKKKKIAIIVLDQRTNRSRLANLQSDEYYYVLFTQEEGVKVLDLKSKQVFSEIVVIDKNISALELAEKVKPYLNQVKKEDLYLLTSREIFMTRVAEVRDILSLSGSKPGDLLRFKDKLVMKDIVSSAGIRTPWHIAFDKNVYQQKGEHYLQEIDHIVKDTVHYPIFVKPIAQEGSVDSKKINDYDELIAWAHSAHFDLYRYEIDEYITGELFECDCLIRNQKIIYTSCSIYNCPISYFSQGKPLGSLDLLPNNPLWTELAAFNRDVVNALDPPDGTTHHEAFRKSNGEWVFLEIGARPPGAYSCQVHEINTGVNFETAHFKNQLNLPVELKDDYSGGFYAWVYLPKLAGKIIRLNEPDIKSRYEITWYVNVGDTVTASEHIASDSELAGLMFIHNKSYEELLQDFMSLKDFVAMDVV